MTLPGTRELYLARVAELRTNLFLEDRLTNRVHELARRIRPTLAAYSPEMATEHDFHVAQLCDRIVERAKSISEQIASPGEPVWFDSHGMAVLNNWTPQAGSRRRGTVQFEEAEQDGRRVLRIEAGGRGGSGAWRTRALLKSGDYRFEGKVQTRGVGGMGGAILRLSGARDAWPQASDDQWSVFSYSFTVAQPLAEVELLCELRTARGEVWFDAASLRLVRE
jgi:hypothetical protein